MQKVQLDNGVKCLAFSSLEYVQATVKNVEECLSKQANENWKLQTKAEPPMTTTYHPELDLSLELGPVNASYYMSFVSTIWWIVELGWVDLCLECSMMS